MRLRAFTYLSLAFLCANLSARSQTPAFKWADQFPSGDAQNVILDSSGATPALTLAPSSHLTGWTAGSSLLSGVSNHALLRSGSHLYLIGGQHGNSVVSDVFIAAINADGSISAFLAAKNQLPAPLGLEAATVSHNVLYLAGGDAATLGILTNQVWMSVLDSDGQPGSWTLTTPLPAARDWLNLIAEKGELIAMTGAPADALTGTTTIWNAPINPDGTLGAWTEGTASIPQRYGAGGFALGDRVWLTGGTDFVSPNEIILADVSRALLGSDGVPSSWSEQQPLPQGVGYVNNSAVIANGRAYLIGGQNQSGVPTSSVLTTAFQSDGALTDWTSAPDLTASLSRMAATATDSKIIAVGGRDSGNVDHSDSFIGALEADAPAATAAYGVFESPTIDLGKEGTIGALSWTTANAGNGSVSFQYRDAKKTGGFGNWSDLTDQSPVNVADSAEYLQYRFILTSSTSPAPSVTQLSWTPPLAYVYGDLNGDNKVNVLDGVLALRITAHLVTPTALQLSAGDVAPKPGTGGRALGDGLVNVLDAVRILRASVKLDTLP